MYVVADDLKQVGKKKVNGKEYPLKRMVIYGNGTISSAISTATDEKGNLSFHDGLFNDIAIAHGTVYVNVLTLTGAMYDEENDTWNEKE